MENLFKSYVANVDIVDILKTADLRIRCTQKDIADLKMLMGKYGWKKYSDALRHLMLYYEGLETKTPIKTYGLEVTARSK